MSIPVRINILLDDGTTKENLSPGFTVSVSGYYPKNRNYWLNQFKEQFKYVIDNNTQKYVGSWFNNFTIITCHGFWFYRSELIEE